jgi:hypothetical protein
MLSDREEQELGLIEQGLRDDSRLAASFGDGPRRRPLHRRPGVVRAAIAFGLVLMVAGLMLAAAGPALQGLLLTSVSYVWWHWKVKPTPPGPAPPERPERRRPWGFPPVV